MGKQIALASLVLASLACGSGDPGGDVPRRGDAIQGSWIASLSAACATGMNFSGAAFSWNVVCVGNDQAVELRSDVGTFTADSARIYVTLSQSTCSDTEKSFYIPYSVAADSLSVTTDTQAIVFSRNPGGAGNGTATLGCFRNGAFTPSPLAPI